MGRRRRWFDGHRDGWATTTVGKRPFMNTNHNVYRFGNLTRWLCPLSEKQTVLDKVQAGAICQPATDLGQCRV